MFSKHELYKKDIEIAAYSDIDWNSLREKSILITGATGLIGTFLIDTLMYRNKKYDEHITIYALGRNKERMTARFSSYIDSPFFVIIQQDIQKPIALNKSVDYIIHGAGNSHPIAFAAEPVNTILFTILGTKSVLDFAASHNTKRTVYLSSGEVYGSNRGDIDRFKEDYCGYIDCNTMRAGYPESKRTAEALCQAYIKEKNTDVVIARCCHVYGSTMTDNDSKVIAQFFRNAASKHNITLKSKGDQQQSYCHVADVCSALLVLLLKGKNGEAYNISDNNCNLTLLQIAQIFSGYTGKDIIFDTPSLLESAGYSKAVKRLLDSSKLEELGWSARIPIQDGLIRTVEIIRNV